MRNWKSLIVVALSIPLFCPAATVKKFDPKTNMLSLGDVKSRELEVEELVCLFEKQELVGCGTVMSLTPATADLLMDKVKKTPVPEMVVILRGGTRSLASTNETTENFGQTPSKNLSISAGMTAGLNYFYPDAHIQLALSRNFSVGVMPMFSSYTGNGNAIQGYGGYLTMSYYHTHSVFRGLAFEGGVGAYNVKASSGSISESNNALAGKFTVGWRGKALWDLGLDIGVAGGVQYIGLTNNTQLDVSFRGFLPLLTAYVGYAF